MRVTMTGLIVCLCWAGAASAQRTNVPVDPFARGPARNAAEGVPYSAAVQRELPPPFVTRQTDVEIPFSVRAGTTPETQPSAVRVFVSWDQGKTWHFYDERKPDEGRFRFRPKQDGEYWFATQTIDASGRPDTADPRRPQLRLTVDTERPQLLVQAQVQQSGEVTLAWSAADATLAPASLKLEYQDAANANAPWTAISSTTTEPSAGTATGQASFKPAIAGRSINLRAEIADAAGNAAYFSQKLSLTPAAPKAAANAAYSPPPDQTATHWPDSTNRSGVRNNPLIATDDHTPAGNPAEGYAVDAYPNEERVRVPGIVENPFLGKGRLASSPQPTYRPAESQENPLFDAAAEELPLPQASPAEPLPENQYGGQSAIERSESYDLPANDGSWNEPVASPPDFAAPEETLDVPQGQRPRLTNSRRFSLDYDVESVGPEGVDAVELWGTTDAGRTWAKWGTDPDRVSPFDVEVNSETVYGFRIVIVGRNGLATITPQPGDAADIWVGVDTTRPTAHLTGAAYGQGEAAGKLDIRWEAADENLSSRPITLSISDRPDGPFTPIAAGLPNTGQYYWEFDPRSPRQIYLRLEVRDDAGNVAIDQLNEPIKVEGLEPKGRIRGFNPGGETPRGAFRTPLFR